MVRFVLKSRTSGKYVGNVGTLVEKLDDAFVFEASGGAEGFCRSSEVREWTPIEISLQLRGNGHATEP